MRLSRSGMTTALLQLSQTRLSNGITGSGLQPKFLSCLRQIEHRPVVLVTAHLLKMCFALIEHAETFIRAVPAGQPRSRHNFIAAVRLCESQPQNNDSARGLVD
jgi:hypothetical protein